MLDSIHPLQENDLNISRRALFGIMAGGTALL